MATPLDGLKVVELARILAGPWAGQTLADLGAEVIKVEAPNGDDTRQWGPPFIQREDEETAAYFHSCNRGKRSVVIDFRTPEGQADMRRLVRDADILIENFKVGRIGKIRARLCQSCQRESAADLLFDHRFRANWSLFASRGV